MLTEILIGMFIAAARYAARWPNEHRQLAYAALGSLPFECFEAGEAFN